MEKLYWASRAFARTCGSAIEDWLNDLGDVRQVSMVSIAIPPNHNMILVIVGRPSPIDAPETNNGH